MALPLRTFGIRLRSIGVFLRPIDAVVVVNAVFFGCLRGRHSFARP